MPGGSVFIVANVLLYARDEPLDRKSIAAAGWLRHLAGLRRGRTNLQVLNEVTNVLLRKRQHLAPEQVFAEVDGLRFFGIGPLTEAIVGRARNVRLSTRYSWWDCLLLASALELGCTHFLSEDLSDGHIIAGDAGPALTIVNPFAHTPHDVLAPGP